MDLQEIYKALRSEYNGKTWSDEFLRIHVDNRGDQIVCWFEFDEYEDKDDSLYQAKRDNAIGFYDEVVRFLVDRFGEEFKYEDPRISSDYIDKNNMYGQYEIFLDDDDENPPVIAIWENEENEMKRRFNESMRRELIPNDGRASFGHKAAEEEDEDGFTLYSYNTPVAKLEKTGGGGMNLVLLSDYLSATTLRHIHSWLYDHNCDSISTRELKQMNVGDSLPILKESTKKLVKKGAKDELTEDAILDAIPVDARDGLIDINEPDGSFGRYTWYVKFAPFSDEEAKEAADGIKKATGRRTQVAGFGREIYVLIMDYPSRVSESKKLVKEGAGAGYTVTIKDLKLGKILEEERVRGKERYEDYWKLWVQIVPGEYEIAAEDYYNDFFWQEHEFGEKPTSRIDGGIAYIEYPSNWDDEEQDWLEEVQPNVENRKLDISFDYGQGWVHVDLPREKIEADHVDASGEFYGSIEKIELNAPDLADAVNGGFQSIYDRDEEEDEKDEDRLVNEVSGWDLEDEDLTLVNDESDGDKLYIVKLWWGSGYMMDCYNAYAFSDEEALNYVVAYIEKTDPKTLEAIDENANDYLQELVDEGDAASIEEAYEHPYFQETYLWVDATREGAEQGHYIYNENLQIAEYPKEHNYPLAKGVKRMNESYGHGKDDGKKKVMDALEEFRQVLWEDTYDDEDHDLRRAWFERTDKEISNAVQKYFKYTRI